MSRHWPSKPVEDRLTRRSFVLMPALLAPSAARHMTRSFWVFGLLKPPRLHVQAIGSARLHCHSARGDSIIEERGQCVIELADVPVQVAGPGGSAARCLLEVPGVIRREYSGVVDIGLDAGVLVTVVTMSPEMAVGSIIGAELPLDRAPFEALAAQAVVSRSVIYATRLPRHRCADFCDTTHCQFLRSPAAAGSLAGCAVEETRGVVLRDSGGQFSPLYSAACGGATERGWDGGHLYQSARCDVCRTQKLARRGHGWGLCQEGAMGLARMGWNWREILAHYYPDSKVSHHYEQPD